jgi:hypothetical protein
VCSFWQQIRQPELAGLRSFLAFYALTSFGLHAPVECDGGSRQIALGAVAEKQLLTDI